MNDYSFDEWLATKGPEVERRLKSCGLKGLIRSAYARGLNKGLLHGQATTKSQIKALIDTLSEVDINRSFKP